MLNFDPTQEVDSHKLSMKCVGAGAGAQLDAISPIEPTRPVASQPKLDTFAAGRVPKPLLALKSAVDCTEEAGGRTSFNPIGLFVGSILGCR